MRKIISLALLGILSLSLFGCYEKNDLYKELDTEKAEKFALDYMNEKYQESFCVVNSTKDAEHGYAPGSLTSYWCDVEVSIKDHDPAQTFVVRTTLDENTKEYEILWDTYMNHLVKPLLKRDIEQILSESDHTANGIELYSLNEKHIAGNGFKPDSSVDTDRDNLNSLLQKYDLWLTFEVYLPESAYTDHLFSDLKKAFESFVSTAISDDTIMITIYTFDDTVFSEVQKSLEHDGKLSGELISRNAHSGSFTLMERDN